MNFGLNNCSNDFRFLRQMFMSIRVENTRNTKSELAEVNHQEGKMKERCSESAEEIFWETTVDWRRRSLTQLPDLKRNQWLITTLDLSGNLLEGRIDWLIHLKRLKRLNLSHNKLTALVDVCGSVGILEHVDVSWNQLRDLPEWILLLEKVKSLVIGHNPLQNSVFHHHVHGAKWKMIEVCHLENIGLTTIPECLHNSTSLKELYLGNTNVGVSPSLPVGNNCIWRITDGSLPATLEVLDMNRLQLFNISCKIWEKLINLRHLKVQGNGLFWPSESFIFLSKLEICDMGSSKIFLLPKEIGNMRSLRSLTLSHNELVVLPESLEQLEQLCYLDLYKNSIESIDCDLAKLPSLIKCDLWMNFIEPSSVLPNHEKLCAQLREDLPIEYRTSRRCEKLIRAERNISDNSDGSSDDELTTTVCKMDDASSDPEESEIAVNNFNTCDSRPEASATPIEESWDEDAYSDVDVDELRYNITPNIATKCNNQDNFHRFLPACLHSSSFSQPHNKFPIIQGQFDDDE